MPLWWIGMFFLAWSCQQGEESVQQRTSGALVNEESSDEPQMILPDQEFYVRGDLGFVYIPEGTFDVPVLGSVDSDESLGVQGDEQIEKALVFKTERVVVGDLPQNIQKDIKICLAQVEKTTVKSFVVTTDDQEYELTDTFFENDHFCVWTRLTHGRFHARHQIDVQDNLESQNQNHTEKEASFAQGQVSQKMKRLYESKKQLKDANLLLLASPEVTKALTLQSDDDIYSLSLQGDVKDAYDFDHGELCIDVQGRDIDAVTMVQNDEKRVLATWKKGDEICVALESLEATFILGPIRLQSFQKNQNLSLKEGGVYSVNSLSSGDRLSLYQDPMCESDPLLQESSSIDGAMDIRLEGNMEKVYIQVMTKKGGYSHCLEKDLTADKDFDHKILLPPEIVGKKDVFSQKEQPTFLLQSLTPGAQLIVFQQDHCQGQPWAFYPVESTAMEWTAPPLKEGTHHISFRSSYAGSLSSCRGGVSWTVDQTAPKIIDMDLPLHGVVTTMNFPLAVVMDDAVEWKQSFSEKCKEGKWLALGSDPLQLQLQEKNDVNTVFLSFRDLAGNVSSCQKIFIRHDDQPPKNPRFTLQETKTKSEKVRLELAVDEGFEMKISESTDCRAGVWEAYQIQKFWSLTKRNQQVDLSVVFRDRAGHKTPCLTQKVWHDDTPPIAQFIAVSDLVTSSPLVDLNLVAKDAAEMLVSDVEGCQTGTWEAYRSLKKGWVLKKSNQMNMIYASFRDDLGNQTSCLSLAVEHDDTPPQNVAIRSVKGLKSKKKIELNLQAVDAVQMYVTDKKKCRSGGKWEPFKTKKTWPVRKKNKKNIVYAKFRDEAKNVSDCVQTHMVHDNQLPKKSRLKIANGRKFTDALSVNLSLRSKGATQMYITNDEGCQKGGQWEVFQKVKTGWILEQENAVATVYVKFRDKAGHETKCLSDTILHDNEPPSRPLSFHDGDVTRSRFETPKMTWQKVTDGDGSGLRYYEVAIGSAPGLTDIQAWAILDRKKATRGRLKSLQLFKGKRFYASIRAVDRAGNISEIAQGDGFLLREKGLSLALGRHMSCMVTKSKKIKCWGLNRHGQLGHGDQQKKGSGAQDMASLPFTDLGRKVRDMGLSTHHHMCALLRDGAVKCWGQNEYGQLGLGHVQNVGDDPLDFEEFPSVFLGDDDVLQLVTGFAHSCALFGRGDVKCWGQNEYGQLGHHRFSNLGDDPDEMTELAAVDLGDFDVRSLSVGRHHTCALSTSGFVKCWGRNHKGQLGQDDKQPRGEPSGDGDMGENLGVIPLKGPVEQIVSGYDHTCALLESGQVQCWGRNHKGQLGLGTKGHWGHKTAFSMEDLPILDLGSSVMSLAAGGHNSCALTEAGWKCWGANEYGQLGQGDRLDRGLQKEDMGESLPVLDLGSTRVQSIVIGKHHMCADADGELKCWGRNHKGQLGQGHENDIGDDPLEMGAALQSTKIPGEF